MVAKMQPKCTRKTKPASNARTNDKVKRTKLSEKDMARGKVEKKLRSHNCANSKHFPQKQQINLIFCTKSLHISNICCIFAPDLGAEAQRARVYVPNHGILSTPNF